MFNQDEDLLLPSIRLNGQKPLSPDMILRDYLRPTVVRAGITGKIIGGHSFRQSRDQCSNNGGGFKEYSSVDAIIAAWITMDVYTHVLADEMTEASRRIFEMMLVPKAKGAEGQHPSTPLDSQSLPSVSINP